MDEFTIEKNACYESSRNTSHQSDNVGEMQMKAGMKKTVSTTISDLSQKSINERKVDCKKIKIIFIFAAVALVIVAFATPNIIVTVQHLYLKQLLQHIEQQHKNILDTLSGLFSYYPAKSCAEIQDRNLVLNSGYYWIQSPNGSAIQVYCNITRICGGQKIQPQGNVTGSLRGIFSYYPAESCTAIKKSHAFSQSKFYWIQSSNGSTVRVYCDMTRTCGNVTGGWMRVAELDMTRTSSQCPPGLCLNTANPRTCRICIYEGSYSLDIYHVGINYSRVCGRVIGYQVGSPDAFSIKYTSDFDGIQLTYTEPRMNIWTFAAANEEVYNEKSTVCPCINPSDPLIQSVPESIGLHYFCDTAAHAITHSEQFEMFFTNNPLWDGAGCGHQNTCCSFNDPPWFYRELPDVTNDDIEMRVCRDEDRSNEDFAVKVVDIYVQ